MLSWYNSCPKTKLWHIEAAVDGIHTPRSNWHIEAAEGGIHAPRSKWHTEAAVDGIQNRRCLVLAFFCCAMLGHTLCTTHSKSNHLIWMIAMEQPPPPFFFIYTTLTWLWVSFINFTSCTWKVPRQTLFWQRSERVLANIIHDAFLWVWYTKTCVPLQQVMVLKK